MAIDQLDMEEDLQDPSLEGQESAPSGGAIRTLVTLFREKPLQGSLILGGCTLAVVLVALGMWQLSREEAPTRETLNLEMAMRELDQKNHQEAKKIALQLRKYDLLRYKELGGASYVLGAATVQQAEKEWSRQRKPKLYMVAARYLEEARDYGFPPDRKANGLLMLAQSLHENKRYAHSLPILREALVVDPGNRTLLHGLLSVAYLRDVNPQYTKALEYNKLYLADERLAADERVAALLLQAKIHFGTQDMQQSRQALDKIPANSEMRSEVILLRGRMLMKEAELLLADPENGDSEESKIAAAEKYKLAVKQLRLAQANDTYRSQATSRAKYLLGVCFYRLEDFRAAESQLSKVRQPQFAIVETIAANLYLAEVKRELGKDQEAVAAYRHALDMVGNPRDYSNPWFSLDELRKFLNDAHADFLKERKFELAVALSESFSPIFSRIRVASLQAEAYRSWARQLAREAAKLDEDKAKPLLIESRSQYRKSGNAYHRLARLRVTQHQYPDDLWESADDFLKGRDFRSAVRMLTEYLKNNARNRTPRALVAMGEAQLALDNLDQSLTPLLECIERYPKHPDTYKARIVASKVYFEKAFGEKKQEAKDKQVALAKNILIDNLHNESLTPRSIEWRNSIFALGSILHREGSNLEAESRRLGVNNPNPLLAKKGLVVLEKSFAAHQEAIKKMSEAIRRYPNAPQALEASYMLAESHHQSAKWPKKKLESVTIETTRSTITRQVHKELRAAMQLFEMLQNRINDQQDQRNLIDLEKKILRNCYFVRADILFELEDYEEAVAAYSSATNRFHGKPESLEAFVQIARCYRKINLPVKAKGTLEQAKVILRRIPQEADFTQTTRYSRKEWESLLDWLSTL